MTTGNSGHTREATCRWCEGTGWLCDGCGRPEALCMASECGGAALSMSGCPHCVIIALRAENDRMRSVILSIGDLTKADPPHAWPCGKNACLLCLIHSIAALEGESS